MKKRGKRYVVPGDEFPWMMTRQEFESVFGNRIVRVPQPIVNKQSVHLRKVKKDGKKYGLCVKVLQAMDKLDEYERIEQGYRILVHMDKNPDFAEPSPSLAVFRFAVEDYEAAVQYANGNDVIKERSSYRFKEELFLLLFAQLVHYVSRHAHGNEEVFRSAGMGVLLK